MEAIISRVKITLRGLIANQTLQKNRLDRILRKRAKRNKSLYTGTELRSAGGPKHAARGSWESGANETPSEEEGSGRNPSGNQLNRKQKNNRENQPTHSWSFQTINEHDKPLVRLRRHKSTTLRIRGGDPGCCGSVGPNIFPDTPRLRVRSPAGAHTGLYQ